MEKGYWIVLGVVLVSVIVWGIYFMPEESDEVVGYVDISAADAKVLIEENSEIVVIDVSPFYEEGHIPGAVWYYYGDGSLDAAIPNLDKDGIYIVYCHFDGPSIAGAQKLIDAGFGRVYRMADHFLGWEDAGYEVEV